MATLSFARCRLTSRRTMSLSKLTAKRSNGCLSSRRDHLRDDVRASGFRARGFRQGRAPPLHRPGASRPTDASWLDVSGATLDSEDLPEISLSPHATFFLQDPQDRKSTR